MPTTINASTNLAFFYPTTVLPATHKKKDKTTVSKTKLGIIVAAEGLT
jgi:hypothetical protein